jgi:hypothetical protein
MSWESRPRYYTINHLHEIKPCGIEEWAIWFEHNFGGPLHFMFKTYAEDIEVSTVFLGIDHNFFGDGPPLIFETMVFRDGLGDEMMRCSTWEQAQEQHREMCQMCISKAYL